MTKSIEKASDGMVLAIPSLTPLIPLVIAISLWIRKTMFFNDSLLRFDKKKKDLV